MRTLFGFGLMAVVLALTVGCGKDKGEDKLDGTYILVGGEFMGEAAPKEEFDKPEEKRMLKIEGNKVTSTMGSDKVSTIVIDGAKSPKTIDITDSEADPKGKPKTVYGIYKLEGDTLTICICMSDKVEDRPKEFKTTKESMSMLMTLKKKK